MRTAKIRPDLRLSARQISPAKKDVCGKPTLFLFSWSFFFFHSLKQSITAVSYLFSRLNQCLSIHLAFQFVIVVLVFYPSFNHHMHADRYVHGHVVFTKGEFAAKHLCLKQCSDPNRTTKY